MISRAGVYDRGVVGWYRAFELTGDLPDGLRVHGLLNVSLGTYQIVRVSRSPPPEHGGVVVLARARSHRAR